MKGEKIVVMNSPIIAIPDNSEITVKARSFDLRRGIEILKPIVQFAMERGMLVSAIGHEATAKLASRMFETEIPANRIHVIFEPGDMAIVIKLKQRLQEGQVVETIEDMEKIGIQLMLLEFL